MFREKVTIGKSMILVTLLQGQLDGVFHTNDSRVMLLVDIAIDAADAREAHQLIVFVPDCLKDRHRLLVFLQGDGVGAHNL